jgi:hypothetical protein
VGSALEPGVVENLQRPIDTLAKRVAGWTGMRGASEGNQRERDSQTS